LTLFPYTTLFRSQSIIDSYKVLAEQKNIELILQINAEEIVGDPVRIKQILYNLVSNAWKFTPQGSITIHTQAIDNGIRCQVIDSGLGISAQEREKIFDKFHQVDSSSTRNSGGTGLGLAITQKLVALHGGTINVDSIEGKGSIFTFTLINQREKARG
jgi:signal transduction histidine kinase